MKEIIESVLRGDAYKYVDKENKFIEVFNPNTGAYIRSGIMVNGKDTGEDPFMRNFPQLIDIGIMGSCIHGESGLCMKSGVQCYQNGLGIKKPNMSLVNFEKIIKQCKGKTFQVALGGRGDVDQHEEFENILKCCKDNGIVPNFTSSGLGFTEEIVDICKKYCGAVAISDYKSDYTEKALNMLIQKGVKTNIHYVLGKNSIDEAIHKLQNNGFTKGVNAVIFLLHKPVGLGQEENMLDANDSRVKEFFEIIDNNSDKFDFKVGFDSCSCSGIVNFTKNINLDSIDFCEGARYSCYIDAEMNMMPCSFGNSNSKWFVDLKEHTILEAWNSDVFEKFRYSLKNSCSDCEQRNCCGGGCPIVNQITLCNKDVRNFVKL